MCDERARGRGRGNGHDHPSTSSGKREREHSNGGDSKRHTSENRRLGRHRAQQMIIYTKPHDKTTQHDPGNIKGQPIVIEANYFALESRIPHVQWIIYKYHVTFEPECTGQKRLQMFLLMEHKRTIGGYLFDGSQLFATRNLHGDNSFVQFTSTTRDQKVYVIKFLFTRIVAMSDQESLQVLNLIQRRNMGGLHLKLVGRNYYDPENMINLNQFNIQLWPGYETSIRDHECGILLNCDVAHKVMRTDTVYDLMREIRRSNQGNFENNFRQRVLGMTVLTDYNNKTYRIDDVDFNITPSSTFTKKNGTVISIKQYYEEKHSKEIRDVGQPLLISQPRARDLRGGQNQPAWLVPEFCRITGLDERQRNDMILKGALKPYSQMDPRVRRTRLIDFYKRIQNSRENEQIIEEWGLKIKPDLVQVKAYCLDPEVLTFAQDKKLRVRAANWDRECGRSDFMIFSPIELRRWVVMCPQSMEREMRQFVNRLKEFSRAMQFPVRDPLWSICNGDQNMLREIDSIANKNPYLILFGTTTNSKRNSDLYASIKKKCFAEHAIASQVLTRHVLNNRNKYDSVVTKVAIQMCTKLGGMPWNPRCPLGNSMTIAFDVARDSNDKNITYGCLVSTMHRKIENSQTTSFFSAVSRIEGFECSTELVINVTKALNAYEEKHQTLPSIIFFYRGGVSEGDILYVRDVELNHIKTTLEKRYKAQDMELRMIYIIVSKHINTRFFLRENHNVRNPEPGTVIDNTITLKERYEFFLVSQKCNQGTISPTNYNILFDTTGLTPEKIQAWTYIQTHAYYNWYGTTRIPAVLQYANKLGFLVSNYMHRVPNASLNGKLYFL